MVEAHLQPAAQPVGRQRRHLHIDHRHRREGAQPLRIGRMAAEVVYEILEGKPYLTNIVVPVNQITQEDILRYGTEGWQ